MPLKAPGKAFRKGISLMELMDVFADEQSAQEWFEGIYWPKHRHCGFCGGTPTNATRTGKPGELDWLVWLASGKECKVTVNVKMSVEMAEELVAGEKRKRAISEAGGTDQEEPTLGPVILRLLETEAARAKLLS